MYFLFVSNTISLISIWCTLWWECPLHPPPPSPPPSPPSTPPPDPAPPPPLTTTTWWMLLSWCYCALTLGYKSQSACRACRTSPAVMKNQHPICTFSGGRRSAEQAWQPPQKRPSGFLKLVVSEHSACRDSPPNIFPHVFLWVLLLAASAGPWCI